MVLSAIVAGQVLNAIISVGYLVMLVWLWEGSFLPWLLNVVIFSIPFGIITLLLRFGLLAILGAVVGKKDS
jgi:hypothetical protein